MGHDEIPKEFLQYGGKAMLPSLVDLFTAISDFELILSDWQKGILKPLHTYGSLFELDNYRGEIILISDVHKVPSKVIEEKPVSYLREIQGVFRKNRRLEDRVFTLQGICSLQKKKNKNTYLAFLDLSKAWREVLFYLLWQKGIQCKCWRLLWSLYKDVNNRVLFRNYESDWFSQDYGVKQGCVLSQHCFRFS
jgi:hypothetical protein